MRGLAAVAGLWAFNVGCWPLLVLAARAGGWRWVRDALRQDLDPVRRWLLSLPPAPPPGPVADPNCYLRGS